jgi:hypothetical protein
MTAGESPLLLLSCSGYGRRARYGQDYSLASGNGCYARSDASGTRPISALNSSAPAPV